MPLILACRAVKELLQDLIVFLKRLQDLKHLRTLLCFPKRSRDLIILLKRLRDLSIAGQHLPDHDVTRHRQAGALIEKL